MAATMRIVRGTGPGYREQGLDIALGFLFSPPVRAVLVIDVQRGVFMTPEPLHEPERRLTRIEALLARARAGGVPVVHAPNCGRAGTFHEAILPCWSEG
jgi:hypothetical protein